MHHMAFESADHNAVGKTSCEGLGTAEQRARFHGLYAGQDCFHLEALLEALTDDQLRRLCAEIGAWY